ncbi:probable prohead core protein protease [Coccomyxa sp. Obi]|nr:probable prohead core protein protease [Coccomyxa sp. Obi]
MIGCLRCIDKYPEEHIELPSDQSSSYQRSTVCAAKANNGETSSAHGEEFPRNDFYLTGILAHADKITINRRCYSKETLVREVQRYHQELILPGNAFGELTHPNITSSSFQSLNPSAVSHQIMAVWWKGDELHGLIRLLDTASGRRAARLLEAGQHLGASSRSWTSLVPDADSGTDIVQDDMHLITFDLTPRPASGSFLRPLPRHLIPTVQSRIQSCCKMQL